MIKLGFFCTLCSEFYSLPRAMMSSSDHHQLNCDSHERDRRHPAVPKDLIHQHQPQNVNSGI
jgi:hypothetical protein